MCDRICGLEPLERDAYDYGDWDSEGRATDSDDECDDAVQAEMRKIAGLPARNKKGAKPVQQIKDPFEVDMDSELETAFNAHANALLTAAGKKALPGTSKQNTDPSSSSQSGKIDPEIQGKRKQVSFDMKSEKAKKRDISEADEIAGDPKIALNDDGADSDEDFYESHNLTKPSDDDLLYDREEDTNNEKWAKSKGPGGKGSDAVLNCPMCMTLLCRDCQRHSLYKTQYRAMFVQNCLISETELLHMPADTKSKRKNAKKNKNKNANEGGQSLLEQNFRGGVRIGVDGDSLKGEQFSAPGDLFKPVSCAHCKTEVAVFDSDEVYHFFNVLSSYN